MPICIDSTTYIDMGWRCVDWTNFACNGDWVMDPRAAAWSQDQVDRLLRECPLTCGVCSPVVLSPPPPMQSPPAVCSEISGRTMLPFSAADTVRCFMLDASYPAVASRFGDCDTYYSVVDAQRGARFRIEAGRTQPNTVPLA